MQNLLLFHAYSSVMLTEFDLKNLTSGTSLAVQWLGLCAFTTKGSDSIPGWGTKILQCGQKKVDSYLIQSQKSIPSRLRI